jgi:3-keto-5-aminohexanoate cleavage enzyme
MAKFDKLIITAAICGAEVMKEDNPYLPTTPEELSDEAKRCYDAGASIVHLHVRDEEGNPTQNGEIFTKTVNMIREKAPELIVQVSTGGATWMTAEQRIESIQSKPDMATLSTGTSNFGNDVFMNTKEMVIAFADKLDKNNIMPEFECFEVGHVHFANWLIQKEHVKRDHYHFDFVIGVPGAIPATVENLVLMKNMIPENATWCVAGIGRQELNMAAIAVATGGHVRVGMEDNIYLSKGVLAKSNAELVERVVNIAKNLNREVAKPSEVKELFGIK